MRPVAATGAGDRASLRVHAPLQLAYAWVLDGAQAIGLTSIHVETGQFAQEHEQARIAPRCLDPVIG